MGYLSTSNVADNVLDFVEIDQVDVVVVVVDDAAGAFGFDSTAVAVAAGVFE